MSFAIISIIFNQNVMLPPAHVSQSDATLLCHLFNQYFNDIITLISNVGQTQNAAAILLKLWHHDVVSFINRNYDYRFPPLTQPADVAAGMSLEREP